MFREGAAANTFLTYANHTETRGKTSHGSQNSKTERQKHADLSSYGSAAADVGLIKQPPSNNLRPNIAGIRFAVDKLRRSAGTWQLSARK